MQGAELGGWSLRCGLACGDSFALAATDTPHHLIANQRL